jgi:hypothetical protein
MYHFTQWHRKVYDSVNAINEGLTYQEVSSCTLQYMEVQRKVM